MTERELLIKLISNNHNAVIREIDAVKTAVESDIDRVEKSISNLSIEIDENRNKMVKKADLKKLTGCVSGFSSGIAALITLVTEKFH